VDVDVVARRGEGNDDNVESGNDEVDGDDG
jgi:hypothetical protein